MDHAARDHRAGVVGGGRWGRVVSPRDVLLQDLDAGADVRGVGRVRLELEVEHVGLERDVVAPEPLGGGADVEEERGPAAQAVRLLEALERVLEVSVLVRGARCFEERPRLGLAILGGRRLARGFVFLLLLRLPDRRQEQAARERERHEAAPHGADHIPIRGPGH
ncbi:MAG: hypothetical protein M5U28_02035 [Sandaracinaceae bacterium]|nr:hypothetical protein [Sandaracinaceae bacterium]